MFERVCRGGWRETGGPDATGLGPDSHHRPVPISVPLRSPVQPGEARQRFHPSRIDDSQAVLTPHR